jgi:hypothetical protein
LETTAERAVKYRLLAVEAEELAARSAFPDVRLSYLSLAKSWCALADEAEQWAERIGPMQPALGG